MHPAERREGEFFSGCYEKYASTTALAARVKALDPELSDGRKIFAALKRPQVKVEVDGWIDEIVNGLQTLIHIFNPSCVILGGGVMAQPYVTEQVRCRTLDRIMPSFRDVKILPAALGNRAGLLGAAWLGSRIPISGKTLCKQHKYLLQPVKNQIKAGKGLDNENENR